MGEGVAGKDGRGKEGVIWVETVEKGEGAGGGEEVRVGSLGGGGG